VDTGINTAAEASFTATQVGFNWSFTNTSTFATSYLWDFGDGNTSTDAHPTYTYQSGGPFPITLVAYGCATIDTSSPFVHVPDKDLRFPSIQVFPNPSDGTFYITAKNVSSPRLTIEVLSLVGQQVLTRTVRLHGGDLNLQMQLDVAPGLYLLRVGNESGFSEQKLAILR
jgi:hypothetical protein